MVTNNVVTVRGLAKCYGWRKVVDGVDLDVLEGEVVGLIGANGAGELVVSAGTVKTHVHHIFYKLDLRNRAAAVIFAIEHDLAGGEPKGR